MNILEETLKHYIDLDMYANTVIESLMEEYNLCYDECTRILLSSDYYNTKSNYSLAYSAIKESVNNFSGKLNERMEEEAENMNKVETNFLKVVYDGILTVGAISLAKTLFIPIDGRDTTKMFVDRTTKNILRSYDNSLRSGYIFGQSSQAIKENADKALKQAIRGMQNGVQTAVPSYAKSTDRIVFLNNNQEVVWCTTLDGNTCVVCASLSGMRYKSISEAPGVQHDRCRCIVVPTVAVEDEIPRYEEFINKLSEEEQLHILGKNRFDLWKNGDITLDKFINNGEKVLLKDLEY